MASNETKHVQTELDEDEYEAIRQLANERGLSLKAAVREALVDWIDRQRRADPNDRAFTVLGELDDEPPNTAATDARNEPDLVDDEDGEGPDFELARNPPARSDQ